MIVDKFPLTPNGKIDRSALPAPDTLQLVRDREFAPPQTETEKILARVWEEVLGLDRIGRFDNFFELGGDSIISLQVVSRAQAEGVHLTPRQLFQEQTVAELARVAQHESLVQAEQGLVTGDLPLTPIQHWFFARYQQNPHHFNQSALLPLEQGIEPELLLQAVRLLLAHHDGLRLRFSPSQQGWQQHLGGQAPELALRYFADHTQCTLHSEDIVSVFNLSSVAEPQRALAAINQKLQASLNISAGPLMRLAVIQMGPGQVDLLLWVIHHLAVDLVSWRLLIPDLWTVYQQLKQGQTPQLAAKSSSLKAWATWLNDYAQEEALQAELAYWRKVSEQVRPLPIDKPAEGAQATVASSANVQVSLTEAETHALLQDVPAIYHTQINDVLLTALALAFMEWTGDQRLVLDLEGHGRESLSDTLDLSRTVGWFTAIYPVCLQLPEAGRGGLGLGEALKSIKEQLRQIPNKGIGYGLLRYLNESSAAQLSSLPQAQVTFNYGGQFKAGPMQSLGGDLAGEQPLSHLIEINGAIADGQLSLQWSYSKTLFHVQTIERLAHRFISSLQELIAHCQLPESGGYTPSDFPLLDLNQIQLDNLVGRGENIAQIYPLSPMQGGMLFHTLYTPNDGAYFEQLSFHLFGLLDVARFQQAWQKVLDRHAALRTGFVWQKVDAPLQIVYQHLTFPWDIQDWRGLTSTEQESALRNLLAKERSKGFDVNRPPLMRFSLIRLGDTQYQVVLHSHHLLFDGWSMPVLFGELFSLYRDIQAVLPPPRPYQDYVAWLQKQDRSQAEKFWRERLAGFTAPTYLGVDSRKAGQAQGYQDYQLALSPELSEQLDTFARRHRLTANTIMQGCIALLLSKYSGETDVVFGVTVAGRPSDLPYSEQMVGLFINTLPLRVKIASEMAILTWLEQIQSDMIQQNEFAYSPLVDIQRWSDLPAGTNLFESIFVFENYPMDKAALTPIDDLQLGKFQAVEQTNYPLTIVALPGAQFSLKITYDDSRFEPTAIERMAGHLETLVASIVATPNQTIGDLPMLTARERRQILVDWNDTKSDYPADKLLHQLFEEQVERTPHKIAVVFEGAELTYRELNARANQLAHYLQHLGVRPETLVGICVERSLEMIVGLLGILKAGGAYVPLDPNYPTERLAFMLQDANVPLLLSQTHLRDSLPKTLAEIVCLDGDWDSIAHYPANNPTHRANPHNLAYVIYTSGSTGKPKGVPINHRGVTNLLHWHQQQFKITAKD
ncbi:MAG: AMP-binding protein, partial [Caldilineaceae bacterium]|nr:AMP-binding protein [Caldilineaceae bacterium]